MGGPPADAGPGGRDRDEAARLMDEYAAGWREWWTAATRCAPRYRIDSRGG